MNNQSSSYRKQKAVKDDLSLFEKLDNVAATAVVLGNVFAALFTGLVRSKEVKPKSLFRYVTFTAIRTLTRRTSVRQQNYIAMPTDDSYDVACKKRGVKPNSVILEDGTKAHWCGDSHAEKLILNFHGGGYTFPASPEHFEFMFQVVDLLQSKGKNVSCLSLSYDLSPSVVYPRQLQQASMLLNHVLNNLNIAPGNIVLTGDSAGGNLALGLLSHLSHPHPSPTIPRIALSSPLCGIALISPWVEFDTSKPSFQRNYYKDCIGVPAGKQWSTAFMNSPWPHTSNSDYYNEATTAPESWWEGLPVRDVLIMAGAEEVLVDGIEEFEKKLSKGTGEGKVTCLIAKGEYHDQPVMDLQMGIKNEGEQARMIKSWISSKL